MYENITTVIGNVASEVRTRITANGHTAASFRVASTTRRYDRSKGGWADTDTNFYTVQCWRQMADNVRRSLSTGEPVIVHGRLKQREWEDEGGRGVSNEIEAYAVGHDMNKGTSSFVRVKAQDSQPTEERNDAFKELAESFMNEAAVRGSGWSR